MCEKCIELDDKISHYERLSSMITDEQILRGLRQAISRMEAEKASLHPERGRQMHNLYFGGCNPGDVSHSLI